jgi:hypothetical protein
MDYLLLARIAKIVALLGFVLPWVTVSCSGTELFQATGIQLMTGDIEPSGALQQAQANTDDAEPSLPVIAACVIVVLGLAVGFLTKGRTAAGVMLGAALGAMALSYFSIAHMRTELMREANETQGTEANAYVSSDQQLEMQRAIASQIQIEEQEGYWLTLGALGVAGILSVLVLAGAGGAPARKEEAPPA